jgi:hypothetical protein
MDLDWYTDTMSVGGNINSFTPVTYTGGKLLWHALGGTEGWPFISDPGELTAVQYAMSDKTYRDIYRDGCGY